MAYAQDEAFGRYFPDTIEALEALGADLIEFSPLRDERLPEGVDLVMIGCGMPDHHADVLASNVSMMAALAGTRLPRPADLFRRGRHRLPGTEHDHRGPPGPGSGDLSVRCRALVRTRMPPAPVTRTLLHDCWLGPRGTIVRGYKSGRWRLIPSIEQFECPPASARSPPKATGSTTTTRSAAFSTFISGRCPRSSTPSPGPTLLRSAPVAA